MPEVMFLRAENSVFHERPTFWFFMTVAFETALPVTLLIRFASTARGRPRL